MKICFIYISGHFYFGLNHFPKKLEHLIFGSGGFKNGSYVDQNKLSGNYADFIEFNVLLPFKNQENY